ncbi:MAG: hypothetical protein DRP83_03795 [Planctomycetota bacterium]|nr:MAG: hypothetical protein DRP83_03795 [Planctomycetota bacterium]
MRETKERKIRTLLLAVLLLAGLGAVGCEPDFGLSRGRTLGVAIPDPQTWRVSSTNGGFKNIRRAADGDASTLAVSARRYRNAQITIDLGKPCLFNLLALRHGENAFGFARKVALSTSMDGKRYTNRYSCPGTRGITYIPVLTQILARYVRITAVVQGSQPWAISEIYLQ